MPLWECLLDWWDTGSEKGKSKMSEAIEFEKQIKEMPDRDLLEYTARTTYLINEHLEEINGSIKDHEERIDDLENEQGTNRKVVSAISAGVALAVTGIFATILRKLGW